MFTLPFVCLVMNKCPYGMDKTLYWTHIAHLMCQFVYSVYHREFDRVVISMHVRPPIPHVLYIPDGLSRSSRVLA